MGNVVVIRINKLRVEPISCCQFLRRSGKGESEPPGTGPVQVPVNDSPEFAVQAKVVFGPIFIGDRVVEMFLAPVTPCQYLVAPGRHSQ